MFVCMVIVELKNAAAQLDYELDFVVLHRYVMVIVQRVGSCRLIPPIDQI